MSSELPTDVEITDPEDFTNRQRLKQIYEARRELREMRRQASQLRHSGDFSSKRRAVQYYRNAVESYLLEVDTLLRHFDPGPFLWHKQDYGTVTIQPPGDFRKVRGYYVAENQSMGPNQPLKVESIPEPKEVPVIGLKWLFEHETPVRRTFEFKVKSSVSNERITKTAKAYIAWNQLNKMVTDVNGFLAELGIGLDTDTTDEWEI